MARLMCPSCQSGFESAGARYTSCPSCGSRLDTRGVGGLTVVCGPTRSGEKLGSKSPFGTTSLGDVEPEPKAKPKPKPQKTVIIRTGSNSDAVPKMMLAMIVGLTFLGCLIVGGVISLIYFLGSEKPATAANKPPTATTTNNGAGGDLPQSDAGNVPNQTDFAPGIFAANGPRQAPIPTPRGNLPGIDPVEFPAAGTTVGGDGVQDILDLFPPGFFGPDGPGGGGPPGFPGGPARPPNPGRTPGPPRAAPGVSPQGTFVTLSNLRVEANRLVFDFDYGNGAGQPFDRYVVKTATGSFEVRIVGLARGRGTMNAFVPFGNLNGSLEVWLERHDSPIPGSVGTRISNILSR